MGELTDTIVQQATATPTSEALTVMRMSALDWIACGIAGNPEPVSVILAKVLDGEGGAFQATGFDGKQRPARATALYNGTASHALDYDDTHFAHIGHVSVGVLPAALAIAEQQNASIDSFLRAGLAGCEAAVRMGLALGRDHYQIGFHQTATAGSFGATLAASLLLSTDDNVKRKALGLASTKAAGLKSQFGTMGKPYNSGLAASTGVEAALLAEAGMIADVDGWDGQAGFIATHHGAGAIVNDGFLMPRVSHKFHACCHGLHATLEALETLRPVAPADVAQINIQTHPRWMTVCNKADPKTGLEAKFSYSAVTAMAILGIPTAALDSFSDQILTRSDVTEQMGKVTVTADETLSEMQAMVRVDTTQGTELSMRFDLDQPLSLVEKQARVLAKAKTLIGDARATAIADLLTHAGDRPVSDLSAQFTA